MENAGVYQVLTLQLLVVLLPTRHRFDQYLDSLHNLLPDVVILLSTIYLLVEFHRKSVLDVRGNHLSSSELNTRHHSVNTFTDTITDYRPPNFSPALSSAGFLFTFVAGVSFPSVITLIFLSFSVIWMLVMAVGRVPIHTTILKYVFSESAIVVLHIIVSHTSPFSLQDLSSVAL